MNDEYYPLGTRVIVEVAGIVIGRQDSLDRPMKYLVRPHDSKVPVVAAVQDIVFADDDDSEAGAEVIRFPLPPSLTGALEAA